MPHGRSGGKRREQYLAHSALRLWIVLPSPAQERQVERDRATKPRRQAVAPAPVLYESQSSFGSIYKTRIEGNTMFCDYYNPMNRTYCKRLRVLCPEHCKDPKVSPTEVCGCPLVTNVFDLTGEFCRAAKKTCLRHYCWEKLHRAQIDMERVCQRAHSKCTTSPHLNMASHMGKSPTSPGGRTLGNSQDVDRTSAHLPTRAPSLYRPPEMVENSHVIALSEPKIYHFTMLWLKLDELVEQERQIRHLMASRAGVLALMLHSTYDHELMEQGREAIEKMQRQYQT
ncbi:hypothetical protein PR048_025216 [Dryococelus australis]|uniref:CXXC-type zinc finger protein 1 n=1 Tax=Dryococelus australis TaxID=614101 RepID=A0ABQ9GQR7_9NEOP|nr:hypothetical protein PR048_025216 [Dryococelus australis]